MFEYYSGLVLGIDDELEFGKHQGCAVRDVIDEDLAYIEWMMSEGIEFEESVLSAVG